MLEDQSSVTTRTAATRTKVPRDVRLTLHACHAGLFREDGINDAQWRANCPFSEQPVALTELDMSGNPKLALPLEDWATFARVELEKLRLDQCSASRATDPLRRRVAHGTSA